MENLGSLVLIIQEPSTPQVQVQQEQNSSCVVKTHVAYPVSEPVQINPNLSSQTILSVDCPDIETKTTVIQTTPSLLRVPFLASSKPILPSVKQSWQAESDTLKKSHPNDPQRKLDPAILSITTDTFYNCYCKKPISTDVHSCPGPQADHSLVCRPEQVQIKEGTRLPTTLTAMAGNQLKRLDESHLEMSGATPPIATVEDIKVPVFIDEYLQSAAKTSTKEPIFNSTFDNNFKRPTCHQTEGFVFLDFDIEMNAEQKKLIGIEMEPNSGNDFILFNSNSNTIEKNSSAFNNNNVAKALVTEEPNEDSIYFISPGTIHYNLSEDTTLGFDSPDMVFTEEAIDISTMNNENYSLSDVFCSSQNDPMLTESLNNFSLKLHRVEPVIPNIDYDAEYAMCIKQHHEQQDNVDIKFDLGDVPHTFHEAPNTLMATSSDSKRILPVKRSRGTSESMMKKRRKLQLNTSTRPTTTSPSPLNTPDVVNLIADWGKSQESKVSFSDSTTPEDIIKKLLDMSDSFTESPKSKGDTICWTTLLENNTSSVAVSLNHNSSDSFAFKSVSAGTTHNASSIQASTSSCSLVYTDEDPPCTPRSFLSTSTTTKTGDLNSSPNSPATATITARRTKKRGRPCKEHSDKPDLARLEHLSEADRKRAQDRARNNEASRLSRLKNKLKEEAEIRESEILNDRNIAMKAELVRLKLVTTKLKRALQRRHFRV